MRTVLVTGGAGFIGSHLVDQLLDSGAAVRVLDNLSTGSLLNLQAAAERHARNGAPPGSRLEVIIGDVRDRTVLRKALRSVKYVFHLAALPPSAVSATDPGDVHTVNVEGTLNLLQGALTEGVWRVVLGSCASVYGIPDVVPVSEEAPLRPTSLFAASKVAAETYCRAFYARHQLDAVMLRYFTVYGTRQRATPGANLTPSLVDAVRQRRPFVEQDDRSAEDFIYVTDAVAATLAAARAPRAAGRAINVGSGQMVAISDVMGILANLLRTSVITGFPRNADAPVYRIGAGTALATELLDFTPRVSLIAGLARMMRSVNDAEQQEPAALEPVGLDD
ncbi:MAG TPA: NAD-dependent epimerase/dehydratase family protein [Methylomirabilota bacterium]|nr:NAD-dependent epimerase/dehydratase family protein [Methylomirabilota bacterium]